MTMRYTIGGTAFLVDGPLSGLDTDTFVDSELSAEFVPAPEFETVIAPDHGVVTGPGELEGAIDLEMMRCWMPAPQRVEDRGWYLRQMAPVFSAVAGRLVLHASAVHIGGVVVAFVGASGAGKSTTARFFAESGNGFVSDDLLPIRFRPDSVVPVGDRLLPLGAVCFLKRTASDRIETVRLDHAEGFHRLITHGFGEHGNQAAWAFQFDAYHRIAEATPTYDLSVPDNLAVLPDVVDAVTKLAAMAPSTDDIAEPR